MNTNIDIQTYDRHSMLEVCNEPYYLILLFDGTVSFSVNFTSYVCEGKTLVFLAPYQLLQWQKSQTPLIKILRFQGDFYCIEYHKEEVSCNGILFNNIYTQPFVSVPPSIFEEISDIFHKIESFEHPSHHYELAILKSYLQLVLALSSKEKQIEPSYNQERLVSQGSISDFPALLERHFLETKSVSYFAAHYGLSVDAFSKKVKAIFHKPPSRLIRERLVLEAKKQLHLTYKSIKEIADKLGFEDEFYFSRYFKKEVGVSPKIFRKKVGISIVAK